MPSSELGHDLRALSTLQYTGSLTSLSVSISPIPSLSGGNLRISIFGIRRHLPYLAIYRQTQERLAKVGHMVSAYIRHTNRGARRQERVEGRVAVQQSIGAQGDSTYRSTCCPCTKVDCSLRTVLLAT